MSTVNFQPISVFDFILGIATATANDSFTHGIHLFNHDITPQWLVELIILTVIPLPWKF